MSLETFRVEEYGAVKERQFIHDTEFLSHEQCDRLVTYIRQHLNTASAQRGEIHNDWADRVIWYDRVEDQELKTIMRESRNKIAAMLQQLYQTPRLYCDSIQLVHWPAGVDMPPHADDRHIDGTPNEMPWRQCAAVVYLNDDYAEGEFCFCHAMPPVTIKPTKGSLVAFGGGLDFAHEVRAARGASRYTMPGWYTSDIRYKEED